MRRKKAALEKKALEEQAVEAVKEVKEEKKTAKKGVKKKDDK